MNNAFYKDLFRCQKRESLIQINSILISKDASSSYTRSFCSVNTGIHDVF